MKLARWLPSAAELREKVTVNGDYGWTPGAGARSASGEVVTETLAMNLTAVWACVNVLAQDTGKLPGILYQRLAGGGKKRAVDHPIYRIVHTRPNPEMTAFTYKQMTMRNLLTWGYGVSLVELDRGYRPTALWPVHPSRVTKRRKAGEIVYDIRNNDGVMVQFPTERVRVMYVIGQTDDGFHALSPIRTNAEAIGLGLAHQRFGGAFYSNGMNPSIIFTASSEMTRDSWKGLTGELKDTYAGLGNAHTGMAIPPGLDAKPVSVDPEAAQLLESRLFSVEEMARIYRMPPHKIQHLQRSTNNNIEHQGIEYVTDCLGPWVVNFEQELTYALLTEEEQREYFIEFLVDALLRGDSAARGEFYSKQFMVGAISPNEIAEAENRNPVEGGDQRFVQLSMVPLEQAQAGGGAPADASARLAAFMTRNRTTRMSADYRVRLRERHLKLFTDAAYRIVRRERNDVREQVKTQLRKARRDADTFTGWVRSYYAADGAFAKYVRETMKPVVDTYGAAIADAAGDEIGTEWESDAEFDAAVEDYTAYYTADHLDASAGQLIELAAATEADALADAIDGRIDEWQETRPDKVAANETVAADGAFAALVFFAAGYDLIWRIQGTSTCPLCRKFDGRTVEKGKAFGKPGDTVDPGDDETQPLTITRLLKHPPLHRGCDCSVTAG